MCAPVGITDEQSILGRRVKGLGIYVQSDISKFS